MPGVVKRRPRGRWWIGPIALLLIVLAALTGSAGLMFPWLLSHPQRVQQFLSTELHRPVSFQRLTGHWRPTGPVLALDDLRIVGAAPGEVLALAHAELSFDFYAFLKRNRSWYEIRIVAPRLDLLRQPDGRWQVQQWSGISSSGAHLDLSVLANLGAIGVRAASVQVRDAATGKHLDFPEVNARFSKEGGGRRLDLWLRQAAATAPVRVACQLDAQLADGRCYLQAHALRPTQWAATWPLAAVRLPAGQLDLDAWLELRALSVTQARVELRGNDLHWPEPVSEVPAAGPAAVALPAPGRLALAASWTRLDADSWQLDVLEGARLEGSLRMPPNRLRIRQQGSGNASQTRVTIEHLRLARALPWLPLLPSLSPSLRAMLGQARPEGELQQFVLDANAVGIRALRGDIRGLTLQGGGSLPGVQRLNGRLRGDSAAVFFELDAANFVLDYPRLLRAPLPVQMQSLLIGWTPVQDGWRLSVDQLGLAGAGFGIDGTLALDFLAGGGKPLIDAVVRVQPGSITALLAALPVKIMSAKTVHWLDAALLHGELNQAGAVIRGDLDDWPFADSSGHFAAAAAFSAVEVAYAPGWPNAVLAALELRFVGREMQIEVPQAEILGNPIIDAQVRIADLKQPLLQVNLKSPSAGRQLLALIRQSPLQEKFADELVGLDVDGPADVDFAMQLPLGTTPGVVHLGGEVRLRNADLTDLKWGLHYQQAHGKVRFSEAGFSADALNVRVAGDIAELNLAVGNFTSDATEQVEASLRGVLPIASVFQGFQGLEALYPRFPGKANWELALAMAKVRAGEVAPKRLSLRSDLRGMALDLPAPLRKDADTSLPLEVHLGLPLAGTELTLQLGQLARLRAVLASAHQPLAAHLAFGGDLADIAPPPGLKVTGSVAVADLGAWAGLGVGGDGGLPVTVAVHAEQLDVLGRSFANTDIGLQREADLWRLKLLGNGIDGELEIATGNADRRGITGQFKQLHWPEAEAAAAPGTQAMMPGEVPPLHAWIGDLRLGHANFGETRIETRPDAGGMRIEEFTTQSSALSLRATGSWSLVAGVEQSALDLNFSAEDLGKMLNALGYASPIEGGQTVARLQGQWSGSPAQFGLDRVIGSLHGEVGEGRILDVDPGAGRLFGLVNLAAIPRRLSLDFKDLFQSGFAFDTINGQFALHLGDASTEDLIIRAPSARIVIRGRAGITTRDYDQQMLVVPRVRSMLPLVGAVAAGPVGVVVGVLAKDMFKKALDGAVAVRYHIGGSWDKPEVILLAKEKQLPAELVEPEPAAVERR